MRTPILHLGLGRFHRAHQAVYFQRLNDEYQDPRWTISAYSMRTPEARDSLRSVNLRYPVLETSREAIAVKWIDRIVDVGTMGLDREKFLAHMSDPSLEIVTLTITEKGYGLDVDGRLDLSSTDTKADLEDPMNPTTAIGWLALGLRKRIEAGVTDGLTILSCDNLRSNGVRLENALADYLTAVEWNGVATAMTLQVTFPCTMVDRIVPALSMDAKKKFEAAVGLTHAELVATETFSQWVIEDRFARPRPPLEKVGVEFVRDVRAHEEMKLRLLNAAHSFLAYTGLLRGHSFVHEAIGDPELRQWVRELVFVEAGPMLHLDVDWQGYGERVLKRFENSRLPHALVQIAMDGSVKIPQRLLPTIEESIRSRTECPACDMAVASWIAFLHREFGPDGSRKVSDPAAARLERLWQPEFTKWLKCLASDRGLFGALADDPMWYERLVRAND